MSQVNADEVPCPLCEGTMTLKTYYAGRHRWKKYWTLFYVCNRVPNHYAAPSEIRAFQDKEMHPVELKALVLRGHHTYITKQLLKLAGILG